MTETETAAPAPGRIRRALRSRAAGRIVPPLCLAVVLGSAAWLGHNIGYERGYDAGAAVADGMRASMLAQVDAARVVDAERATLGGGMWPDPTQIDELPAYVDRELAAKAERLGIPFVYQSRSTDGTPCHPRLRMPDGRDYGLDFADEGDTGALLSGDMLTYGCRSAYRAPGAPR